jgi:ribosomal protein S20
VSPCGESRKQTLKNTTAKSNVVTMLKRVVDAVLPQRQLAFAA